MGPADHPVFPFRSIVAYLLVIIALIIAVCVTILLLLARNQSDLLRSAQHAADYHLSSTVRARAIGHRLWDADRRLSRLPVSSAVPGLDRDVHSALKRTVHLVEREAEALAAVQRQYADSTFEAPLRRVLEQSDRFALAVVTFLGDTPVDSTMILERIDQLRLRLDQLSDLHWKAYLTRETSAARAAGWRRFSLLSIIVSTAGLIPIGIATRQIVTMVRDRRLVEARQRLLLTELDHRVKNNLAAVMSIASQTVHSSSSLDEFAETFAGRIAAMARTHEALASSKWSGIDLAEAALLTLGAYLDATPSRITIEGDPVLLPAAAAMPMCLVLHELSTNAAKHGALSAPRGRVSLSWARRGGDVDLSWVEHGGPLVIPPTSAGLGTQLIEGFIRHELRGEVSMDYRPEGLVCRISVPIDAGSAKLEAAIDVKPKRRTRAGASLAADSGSRVV